MTVDEAIDKLGSLTVTITNAVNDEVPYEELEEAHSDAGKVYYDHLMEMLEENPDVVLETPEFDPYDREPSNFGLDDSDISNSVYKSKKKR